MRKERATDLVLGSKLAHECSRHHDAGQDRGHSECEPPGSRICEDKTCEKGCDVT